MVNSPGTVDAGYRGELKLIPALLESDGLKPRQLVHVLPFLQLRTLHSKSHHAHESQGTQMLENHLY